MGRNKKIKTIEEEVKYIERRRNQETILYLHKKKLKKESTYTMKIIKYFLPL